MRGSLNRAPPAIHMNAASLSQAAAKDSNTEINKLKHINHNNNNNNKNTTTTNNNHNTTNNDNNDDNNSNKKATSKDSKSPAISQPAEVLETHIYIYIYIYTYIT